MRFWDQQQQFYSPSVATLLSSSEALIELHIKGEGGFNNVSSYQHIKGNKSNFFETPCHPDLIGVARLKPNKKIVPKTEPIEPNRKKELS